jgi:hypothetical protein
MVTRFQVLNRAGEIVRGFCERASLRAAAEPPGRKHPSTLKRQHLLCFIQLPTIWKALVGSEMERKSLPDSKALYKTHLDKL